VSADPRRDRDVSTDRLYHLTVAGDWEKDAGEDYTVSTLGKSLEDIGFIHCSFITQVAQVAEVLFRGRDDVLLLQIDGARLRSPLRVERVSAHGEAFPHVYGPLNRDAVVRTTMVRLLENGSLDIAAAL
jgi:glutathione S-transferase